MAWAYPTWCRSTTGEREKAVAKGLANGRWRLSSYCIKSDEQIYRTSNICFFPFCFLCALCIKKNQKHDDIQDTRASGRVSASSSAKSSRGFRDAKEIPSGKVVEDDGSESASNVSEGSEVSSVAFSKELPRLEALEGFEAEEVKGHHGGPPQNPQQMTSESSNESDSLSFEKMENHQAWNGAFLQCRCSKRCTVAQLYHFLVFSRSWFFGMGPGFQAASLVDERDERDLVDPVDSETSQVGFFGE